MHPMPLGESGGSKCKEAPNEGPFRETLGCLARAREASLSLHSLAQGIVTRMGRDEDSGRSLEPGPAAPDALAYDNA
jgi:hypothetical protein